jgi:hypothetical protein
MARCSAVRVFVRSALFRLSLYRIPESIHDEPAAETIKPTREFTYKKLRVRDLK